MPMDIVGAGSAVAGDFAQFARHVGAKVFGAFRRGHVVRAIHPQRELVAPQARDEIARPHGVAQELAVRSSTSSPTSWPSRSFTGLKSSRSANSSVPGCVLTIEPIDVAFHFLEEGAAVEQPGQRVGARLSRHFLLDRLVLQHHADQAGRGADQQLVLVSQPREPGERHSAMPALAPNRV